MEKFRIAQYGLMQCAAIVYGVLSCATAVKLMRPYAEEYHIQTGFYWWAKLLENDGIYLLILPLAWAVFFAYQSSGYSYRNFGEDWIVVSGWIFFFAYVILGSVLAFGTVSLLLDY